MKQTLLLIALCPVFLSLTTSCDTGNCKTPIKQPPKDISSYFTEPVRVMQENEDYGSGKRYYIGTYEKVHVSDNNGNASWIVTRTTLRYNELAQAYYMLPSNVPDRYSQTVYVHDSCTLKAKYRIYLSHQ